MARNQQIASSNTGATGTVLGHVYCADVNAPARMATVILVPVDAIEAFQPNSAKGNPTRSVGVQTSLDGSFAIQQVRPGSYYVVASEPGYLSVLDVLGVSMDDFEKPNAVLKKRIAESVPRVTLQQNLVASIDLSLDRGAALSGTVLFDDGSPAGGLDVHLLVRHGSAWVPMPAGPFADAAPSGKTDDRGRYRISGIPGQEYVLEVDLRLDKVTFDFDGAGGRGTAGGDDYLLRVFSGSSGLLKDAVPVAVKRGEEQQGDDVYITISKLHRIEGAITEFRDGHTVNGGEVELLDPMNKTEIASSGVRKEDGEFSFEFIPEGDYVLRALNAYDAEYREVLNPPNSTPASRTEARILRRFAASELPIHVDGDITGINISVKRASVDSPPSKP